MNKLDSKSFNEVRAWMYRNARPVDFSIWQYLFEAGTKEAVINALVFYQNMDGGFGHALEADSWNQDSSPYTTSYAAKLLKLIQFDDTSHPMIKGMIQFLESGKFYTDNGWLFNIPSNNDAAHAPWWTYNEEANKMEGIGVTLELTSFILEFCDSNSVLYIKAIGLIKHLIHKVAEESKFGDMGIGGYVMLIDTIEKLGIKNLFDYELLVQKVNEFVFKNIERDTSKWVYYGVRPSNYITSPNSIFYKENEDIVSKELDYLIKTRPQNDVWGITWTWFENSEKYAKEFSISENWWKASKAIEIMIFLRNFGRIE